jgi:tetratricopeptide (TPR) repeat protein
VGRRRKQERVVRRVLGRAWFGFAAWLLALAWLAAPASADPTLPAVSAHPPISPRPAVLWYPGFAREDALRSAWVRALDYERRYDYLKAAQIFEHLIAQAPEEPHTYWRIARDYAWLAELTPASDVETRARYGSLAMAWADRGLAIDARCGECCFYKYAGMGRVATARGILSSMAWLRQISQTLDRCMQTPPAFVHEPWNPELGNFYYAAAAFYRMLPDSRVLEISVGARGDPRRSLELSRRAVALAGQRIDYNVGLGASLLCLGRSDDRAELLKEGRAVLERVPEFHDLMPTDSLDRRAARRLIEQPERACGYSRDAWNDGGEPIAKRGQ